MDDATLGGYLRRHDRPPAFTGSDGAPYSVEAIVDDAPDAEGMIGGAVLFVRWSDQGDQPVGHVESPTIVREPTPAAARAALLELSLYRLKELLDEAITAAAERPSW